MNPSMIHMSPKKSNSSLELVPFVITCFPRLCTTPPLPSAPPSSVNIPVHIQIQHCKPFQLSQTSAMPTICVQFAIVRPQLSARSTNNAELDESHTNLLTGTQTTPSLLVEDVAIWPLSRDVIGWQPSINDAATTSVLDRHHLPSTQPGCKLASGCAWLL
jgi:hypothetical protein